MKKETMNENIVTSKWLKIKSMYKLGTNGSNKYGSNFPVGGELDLLTDEFIDILGLITMKWGYDCVVDGVKMDIWKERIWSLVENAGLLPEIAWRDELEDEQEKKDDWYKDDEEEVILDEKLFSY
jgi:hypothetical protein